MMPHDTLSLNRLCLNATDFSILSSHSVWVLVEVL